MTYQAVSRLNDLPSNIICCSCVPGVVCADDYSIGGLVAAAGVAFIFLAIVIAMIVVGFTW